MFKCYILFLLLQAVYIQSFITICLISEELHFCRFPDLQRTAMAVFQMEGHPGKRKIQHKQIWHHRRGQSWQYVLHTCNPHTCILVFCLVYMYETFIEYNNNMHCAIAYVHVELLMLMYICACNFAFFLVGFSCEFTNCLVSSWFASFLMEFLKQEKNAILLVTDLQVADVALCQMAWEDVLWLLLMKKN